jgi:hypothetical protein
VSKFLLIVFNKVLARASLDNAKRQVNHKDWAKKKKQKISTTLPKEDIKRERKTDLIGLLTSGFLA